MNHKCSHCESHQNKTVDTHHIGMFTCPMHPEIVQDKPGACPICGMALEPMGVDEEAEVVEYKAMRLKFIIAASFTLPLVYLAMTHTFGWLQFLLSIPVIFWAGGFFFVRAWNSLISCQLNMFSLIALGVGASFIYSLAALAVPGFFPENFKIHGTVPLYFETAAMITTLVLLGQVLELKARSHTNAAMKALLANAPQYAWIVEEENERQIPTSDVKVADLLRVKPGDNIPVDGVVIQGNSYVNEAMITGESMPVEKNPEDPVIGGTQNQNGSFLMRAEKVGSDTTLAKIIRMVSEAQRSRAPIQGLADKVSEYFVPAVVFVALLTFLIWSFFGPPPAYAHALVNSVAVLIIACPCALGLATPMSLMVGLGEGAKKGILIKNGEALETLEKIDVLLVDKTGTLTAGTPYVVEVIPEPPFNAEALIHFAASLERNSEHPIAHAITQKARELAIPISTTENFIATSGKGVSGSIDGSLVSIIAADPGSSEAKKYRAKGETALSVYINNSHAGMIIISDLVKTTTPSALQAIKALGIKIVMLTGDNADTAGAFAKKLHIEEYHGNVTPKMKLEYVQAQQKDGHIVAVAGDGINDAPALAQANVGIAMGTGNDAAIESAPVTLVKGDLNGIVRAVQLSKTVMKNIRQNLFFAFIYNIAGIPLAAGILYPLTGLTLDPMWAALAMSLSSVSVILNSLRIKL